MDGDGSVGVVIPNVVFPLIVVDDAVVSSVMRFVCVCDKTNTV
jgi:hypothetical protein